MILVKPAIPIYRPQLLGFSFRINGAPAMVTDENACEVFIESDAIVGWSDGIAEWMDKPVFYERIGKDEHGFYLAEPGT